MMNQYMQKKLQNSEHYEYKFGVNDVFNLLNSFDNHYDASSLPMMLLSQKTKEQVSVALSGDGGDELFLGYDRYFLTNNYFKNIKRNWLICSQKFKSR